MQTRPKTNNTAELILDVTEKRVQSVGYNGFSYADIAAELGITTASIHYHFPAKADLGVRLIERYTQRFLAALAEIEIGQPCTLEQLKSYAGLYEEVIANDRLCLCGMMASEFETLDEPMRRGLTEFFERNEEWVADLLKRGKEQGMLAYPGEDVAKAANAIISMLEGAMLVARAHGGVAAFRAAKDVMLAAVGRPGGHG